MEEIEESEEGESQTLDWIKKEGLDKGREIIGEKATTVGPWGRFLQTVDTRTGGTDYTCN